MGLKTESNWNERGPGGGLAKLQHEFWGRRGQGVRSWMVEKVEGALFTGSAEAEVDGASKRDGNSLAKVAHND